MPRKSEHPETRFQRAEAGAASGRRRPRSGRRQPSAEMKPSERPAPQFVEPLLRTGLLMAALRVWELKHGIHDCL
jgi:hypothetical protein